jgi:hypothetical protein
LELHNKEVAGSQSEDRRRIERRLARGLEDVSYLFLSQPSNRPAEEAEEQTASSAQALPGSVQHEEPILLRASPAVNRELLISLLNDNAAVLEEGMRAIDANVPCPPFGSMDLVALGSLDQLCIINVDTFQNDVSLLRGIAHVDWIVRNMPIVRRMYQGRAIGFSIPPRLFLVAPGFSLLLKCVAQRSLSPQVSCFGYRTAAMPSGVGILFERT